MLAFEQSIKVSAIKMKNLVVIIHIKWHIVLLNNACLQNVTVCLKKKYKQDNTNWGKVCNLPLCI